ncbi:hypothetical protein [Shewanella dokdonensis]|uniref:Uncharacterized protein n=1 Tax=Shewanella dokdonensis TaxID=712036 RepID=A0ABX8DBL3_9GAMM|nr:hypothetical protein [Shewanella dokdonensis]MCL1075451.1 hypothetical protein [Shewanella dokdonensis]QVK22136.1 hypothetical protein KHX94_11845 [Shewanella dokdonensis]
MYNTAKKQVWYGELRTARGNAIVIHDNQLPEASAGRIYLYNTQRKAIVEYVEAIVKPNLYELSDEQLKTAESEFAGAWKSARAEFMQKHSARINLANIKDTAPVRKAKPEPQLDDEEGGGDEIIGDDFEEDSDDSWEDEDYEE